MEEAPEVEADMVQDKKLARRKLLGPQEGWGHKPKLGTQIAEEGFLDDYHIVNESGTREYWYHLDDYNYSQLYYWCGRLLLCGMGPDDDDGPTDLEILHGPQPA